MAADPLQIPVPRRRTRLLRWLGLVAALALLVLVGGLFSTREGRAPAPAPGADVPAGVQPRAGGDALSAVTGTAKTVAELQARVAARPDDADARALLGVAYLQRARETNDPSWYPKAETLLSQAYQQDGNELPALLGLGSLALSRHAFSTALDLGQRALALSGGASPSALATIGDAQIELGRYDAAHATFQRLVDQRPGLVAYSRLSYDYELHGELPVATDLMRRAVEAGAGAPENTQWTRLQLAGLLLRQGQIDGAEQEYRHALAVIPDYAGAEAGLGAVAVARGDLHGAEDWYSKAVAHLPTPDVVIALGEVRQALGETKGADDAYALVRATQQLFAANGGNNDLELAVFDANHPAPGETPAQTVARARKAVAERPSILGHNALGWALFKAGDCQAALPEARAATRLGTLDPSLLYHLGAIADCAGHPAEARAALTRALAANPHFGPLEAPAAQALLDRLGGAK